MSPPPQRPLRSSPPTTTRLRPNSLLLDHNNHKIKENRKDSLIGNNNNNSFMVVEGGSSRSAPTTPCSITRRTPTSHRTYHRRASAPRALYTLEHSPNRAAQLLIEAQLERKINLEKELEKDKIKLEAMQKRANELRERLAARNSSIKAALVEEIAALRAECTKLCTELDSSPESGSLKTSIDLRGAANFTISERNEGPNWRCHVCTFQNHPLLNQCESCTMPRIILGTKVS